MTPGELDEVRCRLDSFAADVLEPFPRADQRHWGGVYLRGLLLEGKRKSVEPMAARLGGDGNRQALAHFITSSPWDSAHVRARLARKMQPVVEPTAVIVGDMGFLKYGDASACVSRQYTGTTGKVTNCQVGVSLHLASVRSSAVVNWRLFLPRSWDPASPQADPAKVARRARCGIPADVGHVEKWQLALDMVDEIRSWGIDVPVVVADAGYGHAAAFRFGLEERGLSYLVGLPKTATAHPAAARPQTPMCGGCGRNPVAACSDRPQTVQRLVIDSGRKTARPVQWREGFRLGTGRIGFKHMYSRFVPLRIRPAGPEIGEAVEMPAHWLLAEWPSDEPAPFQFWLSNLPESTPLTTLVRLAKLHRRIEHDYREMKQALGLTDFEGRTWNGWHHHVTLVAAAHAFRTLQHISCCPEEKTPA
ncbi:IS701 family transposase [Streptomyces sporangiiformans]|uniref:IS701 family transposase n=1 Tax=Streptomyces sporangiiformans TaxID=2315329 RepID=A0A505DNR6_9ACTN|nr:IS701 family transposase [Streptomyces sporangiiformans]TPQ22879.1 IS701 family transposase [Streptomyces sporangiiformans]